MNERLLYDDILIKLTQCGSWKVCKLCWLKRLVPHWEVSGGTRGILEKDKYKKEPYLAELILWFRPVSSSPKLTDYLVSWRNKEEK